MPVSSQSSRCLIGDYHFSPVLADFSFAHDVDMGDVTTINDAAEVSLPLQPSSNFSGSGWLDTDGAANAHLDQLNDWVSDTSTPLSWCPSGTTIGAEVAMITALVSQFTTGSKVASVTEWSMTGQSDGQTDFGRSLHALGAETTSTNSTSYDGTSSSSNGGAAHLHITAFSGLTNIIVKVQHSTDNSSWSDLVTFSTATGVTSQRSTVSSTVNRYLRASWTVTGTGSCTFFVGFARR